MDTKQQVVQSSGGGIGFGGLLAIVFITLKLCGVISWSWWWVLSPLWIPLALVLGGLGLFGVAVVLLAVITACVAKFRNRKAHGRY